MLSVKEVWERFCALRFVIVGVWNTVFSYLVFAVLYRCFGGGWNDVPVQIISAIVGITNAFVFHRLLTYRSHGVWWREYLRFYVVYGVQVALQSGFFLFCSTWIGLNAYLTQFVLTLGFTIFSYWAHKSYSFGNGVCARFDK